MRQPGANVLETELQYSTLPLLSKALQAGGRKDSPARSPYTSSSIKGTPACSNKATSARLCSTGMQAPSGFCTVGEANTALGLCFARAAAIASGTMP
ncbi:hypothetical protein SDC9_208881 [bioreactor metagenome]|uniref:Uncharacterized protein n=1 Tax=bioreactor metagenome TaxID=1076179 RepID=A0A645JCU0_9ZZZZ